MREPSVDTCQLSGNLGQSPLFESSLEVKVLEVSMPESLVAESWLVWRSDSQRSEAQS